MRRDLVTWTFALGVTLIVLLSFTPAFAFTNAELLGEKTLHPECKDGVCTIKEDELAWVINRASLLERIAVSLGNQVKMCGGRGV